MKPIITVPVFKDYLWGGDRLRTEFHKECDLPVIAESWELSCNPHGFSGIAGQRGTLLDFLQTQSSEFLGTDYHFDRDFPILIKLIDAKKELSVQVHPDDRYAASHEGGFGKTEMWVVMEAEPGAALYYGVNRRCTKQELRRAIADGTLTEYLNRVQVHPGDVFFIRPGTIHAIGAGILLAEIQQNSDITYRLYDYNRRDANGNLRRLDVDKALDIARLEPEPAILPQDGSALLAACEYFSTFRLPIHGTLTRTTDPSCFEVLLVLRGSTALKGGFAQIDLPAGTCVLLPAALGDYTLEGEATVLRIFPKYKRQEQQALVRKWQPEQIERFRFADREAIVVHPSGPSNGRLVWKAEYFDAFQEFEQAMSALGYTVCFLEHQTRWANDEEVELSSKFLEMITDRLSLDPRCIAVGMSCGGLLAARLAEAHPELISVLYLDAPVLNILSMAGLGDAEPQPEIWRELVATYGFSRSTVVNFRQSPIDRLDILTRHHIPVIQVYGNADSTVIYEENGKVLESFYRKHGGTLTVICKSAAGHHPHGLSSPQLIIDFAEAHFYDTKEA